MAFIDIDRFKMVNDARRGACDFLRKPLRERAVLAQIVNGKLNKQTMRRIDPYDVVDSEGA